MRNNLGCGGVIFFIVTLLSSGLWGFYGSESTIETSETDISEVLETSYTTSCETRTTNSTTATSSTTVTTTATTITVTTVGPSELYLGDFKGTYYRGDVNPCPGGSGRMLIDCATGGVGVKGSVACRYVWSNYGYSYCGSRTVVRIEVPSHPEMNGMYYVDDCCASNSVVDFYYPDYSKCPFQYDGVVSCRVWVLE